MKVIPNYISINMKLKLLIFPILLIPLLAQAQTIQMSVIAGGGGYETSASNSVSWTLGEAVIETLQQGSNILTQGFQQPNYDAIVSVLLVGNKQIIVKAFPNPATDEVSISFSELISEPFLLAITDAQGKKLGNYTLKETENKILIDNFANGIYFLNIRTQTGKTTSLQIVKY